MKLYELTMGTRLELEIINNRGEIMGGPFISQLLEPVRGLGLTVSAPIFESRIIFIPLNAKVRITYCNRKYGILGFTSIVVSRDDKGNVAVLHLQQETPIEKIQRREHYRLDCHFSAEYRISGEKGEDGSPAPFRKAITKNMSGSGVCIVARENIPKNTAVDISIDLNSATRIKAKCIVLRNSPIEIRMSTNYELGLRFEEITPRDQDYIIRFIFAQQRMLLKKDILDK